ncbi:glutaredoxin family protein [Prochlorococcus marinus]|uniref:glutaredoxin family protein n=1 Tax=Prochlorococcus marinus TaxID=1219 RepID=UPI0022B53285|nr:glutaredoxin family protein [Prochlorococcus marinus]
MDGNKLILLSRVGCCLCEGLEERLNNLDLNKLNPPLNLWVRDIDGESVSEVDRARYSLEVPVLLLAIYKTSRIIELPRVSPRLSDEGLFTWLQKNIQEKF